MFGMWWVWLCIAVTLGILEVLIPGYIFLGFSVGAAITGIVMLAGGPLAGFLVESLPATLLFFALISLVVWLTLRRIPGIREGQVKKIDRDINED